MNNTQQNNMQQNNTQQGQQVEVIWTDSQGFIHDNVVDINTQLDFDKMTNVVMSI